MEMSAINYETVTQTGAIIGFASRYKHLCSCVSHIPKAGYEYWAGLHDWVMKTEVKGYLICSVVLVYFLFFIQLLENVIEFRHDRAFRLRKHSYQNYRVGGREYILLLTSVTQNSETLFINNLSKKRDEHILDWFFYISNHYSQKRVNMKI